jgi:hypothetical protein
MRASLARFALSVQVLDHRAQRDLDKGPRRRRRKLGADVNKALRRESSPASPARSTTAAPDDA